MVVIGDAPLILEVHAGQGEQSNDVITWVTNWPTIGVVEYWLDDPEDVQSVLPDLDGLTNDHRAFLSLTPGATFHFRVRAWDAAANETQSEWSTVVSAGGWGPRLAASPSAPWPGLRTHTVNEGEGVSFPVFTPTGDISIVVEGIAPFMSFDGSTFVISPGAGDTGIYGVTLTSTDTADGTTDVEYIVIIIKGPSDLPIVQNLRVIRVTDTSATIRWTTDVLADARVEYGLDTNYGSAVSNPVPYFTHYRRLTGLSPDTVYHYRIVTKDSQGRTTTSPDCIFTTNDSPVMGTDYYVASDGDDANPGTIEAPYLTIQHAADQTQPGDTVVVRGGTYYSFVMSNLERDGFRSPHGTMEAPITFRPYTDEEVILIPYGGAGITIRQRSFITVDGFIIDGTGLGGGSGVIVEGEYAGFNQVLNCEIRHAMSMGIAVKLGAHDNIIRGNRVYHNSRRNWPRSEVGGWDGGISCSKGGAREVVEDNVVYWNHGEGMVIGHIGSVARRNIVCDNWSVNFYVTGPQIVIEQNLVYVSADAIDWPADAPERNHPPGVNMSVESVDNAPGATKASAVIRHNIIVTCFNPVMSYAYGSGIPYTDIVMVNNTLVNNYMQILWAGHAGNPLDDITIRNNLVIQPPEGIKIDDAASAVQTMSLANNWYVGDHGGKFTWTSQGLTSVTLEAWRTALTNVVGADNAEVGSQTTPSATAGDYIVDPTALPPRLWTDPSLPDPPPVVFDSGLLGRLAAAYAINPSSPATGAGANIAQGDLVMSSITIDVLANDTDLDGVIDVTSVEIATAALHGTTVVEADGQVTYTPEVGYVGADSFQYTVKDEDGAVSNTATVTLNVVAPNVPPEAVDDGPIDVEGN